MGAIKYYQETGNSKARLQARIYKKEENQYTGLFSLIGPPHPYWIDIYPIEIEFTFNGNSKKSIYSLPPKDFQNAIKERGFIEFPLTLPEFEQLAQLKVTALYIDQKQVLYSYSKEEIPELIIEEQEVLPVSIASFDGKFDGVYKDPGFISIEAQRKYDGIKEDYRNNIAQAVMTLEPPKLE